LSKTISKHRYVGVIGLVISIVAIISIFAYFSFYSNINFGFVGNDILVSNSHDLTNHPTGNYNSGSNLDENTSSILVALWIGLMIIGSYLLFHIHFKVLPKE
jgi:beta-lactamase regulating signal transducer with metallopeptidase domain